MKSKRDTSNKENQTTNKKSQKRKRKLEVNADATPTAKKVKPEKGEQMQKNKGDPKIKQPVNKIKVDSPESRNIGKDNNKKNIAKKDKNKENDKKPVIVTKKKIALISQDSNKDVANGNQKIINTPDSKEVKLSKPIKTNNVIVNKVKNGKNVVQQKKTDKPANSKLSLDTPKKVKFVLKNNGAQAPIDYYKSVRQSPNIPFDSSKIPTKTNLKPSMPSPINPFFKKKLKLKK